MPLRTLASGAECIEPVRYAYRSFDRQWVLPDARLGDFMRPALWRIAGPRQIFLTSMLTNVLGPGPAAVATALVPDLDCFRGSFGARAVMPLWCDAEATRPNSPRACSNSSRRATARRFVPTTLLAYCYALLATARLSAPLRGGAAHARPTRTRDRARQTCSSAPPPGPTPAWLHTYGQRCAPMRSSWARCPSARRACFAPVGPTTPTSMPMTRRNRRCALAKASFGPDCAVDLGRSASQGCGSLRPGLIAASPGLATAARRRSTP